MMTINMVDGYSTNHVERHEWPKQDFSSYIYESNINDSLIKYDYKMHDRDQIS